MRILLCCVLQPKGEMVSQFLFLRHYRRFSINQSFNLLLGLFKELSIVVCPPLLVKGRICSIIGSQMLI